MAWCAFRLAIPMLLTRRSKAKLDLAAGEKAGRVGESWRPLKADRLHDRKEILGRRAKFERRRNDKEKQTWGVRHFEGTRENDRDRCPKRGLRELWRVAKDFFWNLVSVLRTVSGAVKEGAAGSD